MLRSAMGRARGIHYAFGRRAAVRQTSRSEPLEPRLLLAVTFGVPLTYAVPNGTYSASDLALGDFNRDGKPDLAMAFVGYRTQPPPSQPVGAVAVFLNSGGGFF